MVFTCSILQRILEQPKLFCSPRTSQNYFSKHLSLLVVTLTLCNATLVKIIINKDCILEAKRKDDLWLAKKRSVLKPESIKATSRCLTVLNDLLTNRLINLLNLNHLWLSLLLLTHDTLRNPMEWHAFFQWPNLQMGQATLLLFWVGCGFVGRWQGANEELMSLPLANCQPQDGRLRAFVCISPGQRKEGLGESQLQVEELDSGRLLWPIPKVRGNFRIIVHFS